MRRLQSFQVEYWKFLSSPVFPSMIQYGNRINELRVGLTKGSGPPGAARKTQRQKSLSTTLGVINCAQVPESQARVKAGSSHSALQSHG